jgi:hypothetical protein
MPPDNAPPQERRVWGAELLSEKIDGSPSLQVEGATEVRRRVQARAAVLLRIWRCN